MSAYGFHMDQPTYDALNEALEDEYQARATYRAVIETFGPVRPFINIVDAEARHIRALHRVYARHGLTPPPDRWSGQVAAPSSVDAACRAAVRAERENDAMYARLLPRVQDPEIRAVMQRLREASRERHLPAFERCVARKGRGGGHGRGRGRCGMGC